MSIDQLDYYSTAAFLFFLLGIMVAGVTSSVLFSRMFQEVNERLPPDEKMSPWFGHPGVLPKVERLHRRFYPDSNLRRNLNRIIAGGLAAVVGLAISLDLM